MGHDCSVNNNKISFLWNSLFHLGGFVKGWVMCLIELYCVTTYFPKVGRFTIFFRTVGVKTSGVFHVNFWFPVLVFLICVTQYHLFVYCTLFRGGIIVFYTLRLYLSMILYDIFSRSVTGHIEVWGPSGPSQTM